MNRLSASVLGSLLALTLASGAAWAQDEGEGEAGGGEAGGEASGGEAGTGEAVGSEVGGEATGGEMAAGAEMSMGIGPYTKANYPQEALWRPLTLPKGMIQVSPAFGYTKIGEFNATGSAVIAEYGVMDKLTVGLDSGLGIDPEFEWSKFLGLHASFLAVDQEKLDVAAGLSTALNFNDGADVFESFDVNAQTRFLVHPKVGIFAGAGLLNVTTAPEFALGATLQLGVGFQATKQLMVRVDTIPVHLKLAGDLEQTVHYGDAINGGLSALFAINNKIDVYAQAFFPDFENAGDFYQVGGGAALRF